MYPPALNQPLYSTLLYGNSSKKCVNRILKWNKDDSSSKLELENPDLVSFPSGLRPESACIRTTSPIDLNVSIFYWEVTVTRSSTSASPIAIGISTLDCPLNRFPGWEPHSYGYHGDDGQIFNSADHGTLYGPTFGSVGDTIGFLLTFAIENEEKKGILLASVRYTKNGILLPIAFIIPWDHAFYPTLGLRMPGDCVASNFGSAPFLFDIVAYIHDRRQKLLGSILKTDVPYHFVTQIPQFFAEHFIYNSFSKTLVKLSESVNNRSFPHKGGLVDLVQFAAPIAKQISQREQIASCIRSGHLSDALNKLESIQGFLPANPGIYFELRAQLFIELVRNSLDTTPSISFYHSVLDAIQSISDVYIEHNLKDPYETKLLFVFSLVLYLGNWSDRLGVDIIKEHSTPHSEHDKKVDLAGQFPPHLLELLSVESRVALSRSVINALIQFSNEKLYSNIEFIYRHALLLFEEIHSHPEIFPTARLVSIQEIK